MKKLLILAFACLSLGLVATGCGGDDDEDTGGSGDQPAQTEEEASGGGGTVKSNVEVGMKDIQFDPAEVTVKKGGTITWTNNESVPHDVTKEDGPGPDFSSGEGDMQEGDTFGQKFTTPGKIAYLCTVHPQMTGTITVK